jgi:hypothetical protein
VEVRQCAAHYLMPSRESLDAEGWWPPKLQQDLDSCALLVQHGSSATHYRNPRWVQQLLLLAYAAVLA